MPPALAMGISTIHNRSSDLNYVSSLSNGQYKGFLQYTIVILTLTMSPALAMGSIRDFYNTQS